MTFPSATEADAELPAGWALTRLSEACELNPRRAIPAELAADAPVTFVPMPAVDAELGAITTPLIRPLAAVRKGFTAFRDGDVIMAKITPCMENGKAAIARSLENGLGFGSTEFHVLRAGQSALPEYLYYFIRRPSFRKEAEERMTGSVGQKRVPAEFLASYPLPLPPLGEQRRIVAALDATLGRLDAARARLARVPEILKRYRASLLKAACEGRLVPTEAELARAEGRDYEPADALLARILGERRAKWEEAELAKFAKAGKPPPAGWRAKYKEPAVPDTSELPDLPEGWGWATVEGISAEVVDCAHSTPVWTEHGKMCVRTTEFTPGKLDLSEVRYVSEAAYEHRVERLTPRTGDVLYSREGGILGIACIVPSGADLCLGQRMMLMRAVSGVVPEYLMWCLNSHSTLARVRSLTGGTASPHLNVADIKHFPVPLPPLAEQRRIVAAVERQLAAIGRAEAVAAANLRRCERMREAVLAKAFRGELA